MSNISDALLLNPMAAGIIGVTGLLAITSLIRTNDINTNSKKNLHTPRDFDASTDSVHRHHPMATVPAALEYDGLLNDAGEYYRPQHSHLDDREHPPTDLSYLDSVTLNEPVFMTN